MTRACSILLTSAALSLLGCGDEGGAPGPVEGFDPRLRGIYGIETHTRNDAACEAGGESVEALHSLLAIDAIDYHGRYFLGALSCADPTMCRSHIAAAQAPEAGDRIPELEVDFFYLFTTSLSDGSASALAEGATALDDGSCVGRVYSDRLTRDGERVRIESRIADVPPFPPSGGECVLPAGSRELPCTAFELLTGVLSEQL